MRSLLPDDLDDLDDLDDEHLDDLAMSLGKLPLCSANILVEYRQWDRES